MSQDRAGGVIVQPEVSAVQADLAQEFDSPEEAILMEKRIKGWRRAKKLALIKAMNPGFQDLSTLR